MVTMTLSYTVLKLLPLYSVCDCLWPWEVLQFKSEITGHIHVCFHIYVWTHST